MEVKRHLLHCLRNTKPAVSLTPDLILVDAGENNYHIKSELERWMEKHPGLRRIRIVFPRPRPWFPRAWLRIADTARRLFGAISPLMRPG
jgi:hypothetical protein